MTPVCDLCGKPANSVMKDGHSFADGDFLAYLPGARTHCRCAEHPRKWVEKHYPSREAAIAAAEADA